MSGTIATPSKKWSCSTLGEGLCQVLAQSYPDGEEEALMKELEDTMSIVLVSYALYILFATQMPSVYIFMIHQS